MDARAYLESVGARLRQAGFTQEPPGTGAALAARRRAVKLSRFGLVETVVAISTPCPRPGPDELRRFGADSVRSAVDGKSRIPRGLGSSVVVYPVLVADGIPDELTRFVSTYAPKHWSLVEFPVVVDPAAGALVQFEKTPAWGGAYYKATRLQARELLSPS